MVASMIWLRLAASVTLNPRSGCNPDALAICTSK